MALHHLARKDPLRSGLRQAKPHAVGTARKRHLDLQVGLGRAGADPQRRTTALDSYPQIVGEREHARILPARTAGVHRRPATESPRSNFETPWYGQKAHFAPTPVP